MGSIYIYIYLILGKTGSRDFSEWFLRFLPQLETWQIKSESSPEPIPCQFWGVVCSRLNLVVGDWWICKFSFPPNSHHSSVLSPPKSKATRPSSAPGRESRCRSYPRSGRQKSWVLRCFQKNHSWLLTWNIPSGKHIIPARNPKQCGGGIKG